MNFVELSKEEFNNFAVNYIPNSPYQTSGYGLTMYTQGYNVYFLGLVDGNDIKAATMVMVKNEGSFKYGYVPKGFLLDYRDKTLLETFTLNLRKYLNSKSVVAIKICPIIVRNIYDSNYKLLASNPDFDSIFNNLKSLGYYHLGFNNLFEALKPRFEAIIDLNKDYISLFQDMSKAFKTKVRSSENSGVRIHKGDNKDIEILYEQVKGKYPRNQKYFEELYKNFDGMADIYYAKVDLDVYSKKCQEDFVKAESIANEANDRVLKNLGKSHQSLINKKMAADKNLNICKEKLSKAIELMSNHPEGIVIATVLVIKTKDTVTVMVDSFDRKYNSFNAKHLIIWKLMEKYSKEGYHLFNLGGIVGNIDSKYRGLNDYKLGFGSKVYEYIGDFEFITNKPLYLMYKNTGFLKKKNG